MTDADWKRMAGTEQSNEYVVIARNSRGDRLGIRPLGNGTCRIRVEPVDRAAAKELEISFAAGEGWKQPDEAQLRFSIVESGDQGERTVLSALEVIAKCGDGTRLERNRNQRAWQWRTLLRA